MMQLSLPKDELLSYVLRQLNNFFPDGKHLMPVQGIYNAFENALERTEYCFKHVALSSFYKGEDTLLSHLHADQYCMFLWFFSNSVWRQAEDTELASKLFLLNKALNGFLCMYDADLPEIFLVLHGNGTVLGKAKYDNFFVCHHGCTVGAVHGKYPTLGKGVALAPMSAIVGSCEVGNGVTIGTGALARNINLPHGALYYRHTATGQPTIDKAATPWAQSFFNVKI